MVYTKYLILFLLALTTQTDALDSDDDGLEESFGSDLLDTVNNPIQKASFPAQIPWHFL